MKTKWLVFVLAAGCTPVQEPTTANTDRASPRTTGDEEPPKEAKPGEPRVASQPDASFGHEGFGGAVSAWAELGDDRIAAGYTDGTLRVWAVGAGTSTAPLTILEGPVLELCTNASGLLASSDDGHVVWASAAGTDSLATLDPRWCGDAKGCRVRSLQCAANSEHFGLISNDTLHIGTEPAEVEYRYAHGKVLDAALASDGSLAIVARAKGDDGQVELRTWTAPFAATDEGTAIDCAISQGEVSAVQFAHSPDGRYVAAAGYETDLPAGVCLIDLGGPQPKARRLELEYPDEVQAFVDQLEFRSATKLEAEVAYGYWGLDERYDEAVVALTWDASKGSRASTKTLDQGATPRITATGPQLKISEGGKTKALPEWSEDDELRRAPIAAMAVSADDAKVWVHRERSVLAWTGDPPQRGATHAVPFVADGPAVAMIVSEDATISLHGHHNIFSDDHEECGLRDLAPGGLVRVDLETGKSTELVRDDLTTWVPLAFLPGTHTALVCREIYPEDKGNCDFPEPRPRARIERHDLDAGTVEALPFELRMCPSQAGLALPAQRVASVVEPPGQDLEAWSPWEPLLVEVVDMNTGARLFQTTSERDVDGVALSADGTRLAIGGPESVELIEVDSGEVLQRFEVDDVTAVALSAAGRDLAVGTRDGSLRSWHVGEPELSEPTRAHTDRIEALWFGRSLYSVSEDRRALRWPIGP